MWAKTHTCFFRYEVLNHCSGRHTVGIPHYFETLHGLEPNCPWCSLKCFVKSFPLRKSLHPSEGGMVSLILSLSATSPVIIRASERSAQDELVGDRRRGFYQRASIFRFCRMVGHHDF